MPTSQTTSINTCISCGGKLSFDFKTNSNKCEYCGNEFPVITAQPTENEHEVEIATSYIPFYFAEDIFKEKVQKWLTEGDYTPTDMLSSGVKYHFRKKYIPVCFFSGEYFGKYTTLALDDTIITENIPISGKYEFVQYAGLGTAVEQKILEDFLPQINLKDAIPSSDDEIPISHTRDSESMWEELGVLRAAQQVYQKLTVQDAAKKYKHYLTYQNRKSSLLYIPFIYMPYQYSYEKEEYEIFMNGRTGELFGTKPVSRLIAPPTRTSIFTKYLLIGLGLWFFLLILRAAFRATIGPDTQYNNLLISPPAELYWLIRGAFFLLVLPSAMAIIFFPYFKNMYFKKLLFTRKQILERILTGRAPSPFA